MAEAKYTVLTRRPSRRKFVVIVGLGLVLVLLLVLVIVFATKETKDKPKADGPKKYIAKKYTNGAVAADATLCSDIGAKILRKNGSAADAAIATIFCVGVVNPMSTGIGGGGFLVIYERKLKKFTVYDYREEAPAASNKSMYVNNLTASRIGGLAAGIPGEVKGLYTIHQKHGKLSWADLVEPSIKLAEEGVPISKPVAFAIKVFASKIAGKTVKYLDGLKKLLTNEHGEYLVEGDLMMNPELGRTLRVIQMNGSDSFYYGELAKNITRDLKAAGGIITMNDMKNYTVNEREIFNLDLTDGYKLNTMPLPGGGPIVAMIHNIMSGYKFSKFNSSNEEKTFEFYQRLIESMKFSYAQRGFLGDPMFVPKDNITKVLNLIKDKNIAEEIRKNKIFLNGTHKPSYYGGFWGKDDFGTSHMSLIAENGDAVSATGTVNTYFGSLVRSPSTGIIFNNEMDDFSTPGHSNTFGYPPSPANYIEPGKRPLSSMSPSIVTDTNGDVKMVAGASGGSRIISGTATVILKSLYLGMDLGDAVASYRLHNQGVPNIITSYKRVLPPSSLVNKLKSIGHTYKESSNCVVQAIVKDGKYIYAMSDPRKGAEAAGY